MKLPVKFDEVLLPREGIDMEKWCVVACDQFTSQPEYWEKLKEHTQGAPSALNLIYPECYLSDKPQERIAGIIDNMNDYLSRDIFRSVEDGLILVERTTAHGNKRYGLMMIVDLTQYSFDPKDKALIRATEETVLERIPPRVNIRKGASLELPHIMLLIDDINRTVIEPLDGKKASFDVLYDFDLMQNAGHIKGYALKDEALEGVQLALDNLANASSDGFLYAMGDGNHSLASAKECYNQGKGPRYALAEVVNIHDASLEFEPIYRVLFGVEPEKVINDFVNSLGGEYEGEGAQKFICTYGNKTKEISVKGTGKLCIATLQSFLDGYIKNTDIKVDYIHGENSVCELSKKKDTLGFIFSGMEKSELFPAIIEDGSLPRKTFSMGHADDKRFYLEARKIV